MKIKLLILSLAIFSSGCFGSPAKIAMISEEDLKSVETLELCAAYGNKLFGLEKVKTELINRLLSYQHGLEDRTAVHQYKSGKIVVMHQDKSGIKAKLPDKGEVSSESKKISGESQEEAKLRRLMKVKLAEQSPPDGWEWELIEKGMIKKGMTQCGLLASWGMPSRIVERSRRVDEWIYLTVLPYGGVEVIGAVQIRKGKIKKWNKGPLPAMNPRERLY